MKIHCWFAVHVLLDNNFLLNDSSGKGFTLTVDYTSYVLYFQQLYFVKKNLKVEEK